MMNYEIFKEVVAEKFMDYMPEQYQGMRLRVEPVNKVNKVLDGITLVGSGAGRSVSPTLYINHMYNTILRQRIFRRCYRVLPEEWIWHSRKCPR